MKFYDASVQVTYIDMEVQTDGWVHIDDGLHIEPWGFFIHGAYA